MAEPDLFSGPCLWLDFETRSGCDIKKTGSHPYIEHPDFTVLLLSWAVNDEPVQRVDFMSGGTWPERFVQLLRDPQVLKIAQNDSFERGVLQREGFGWQDPMNWFDTAVLFASCGLPRDLDGACKALRLPEDKTKMKEGRALIRFFSHPWNLPAENPEEWALFGLYCDRDVESMRTAAKMLRAWLPLPEERRFRVLDAKINEAGCRIDWDFVAQAVRLGAQKKAAVLAEIQQLTGVENPNSVKQIVGWMSQVEGFQVESLRKDNLPGLMERLKSPKSRRYLTLRAEAARSSLAKYEAMEAGRCADGTVKGCFMFYGASRTGRFAGRQVQFQNLPRNEIPDLDAARALVKAGRDEALTALYDNPADILSQLIRTAIIPEDGHQILVADFSAIEARVIAWLAGEKWRLEVFQNGGDIYCASASQMFGVPVVKHGINGELRAKGKVAELALGYGGGSRALLAFGADRLGMTQEEMDNTVTSWRKASPRIVQFWYDLESAAKKAIVKRTRTVSETGGIEFSMESGILWMRLPSGRRIAYFGAKYEKSRWNDRKSITYMGISEGHWTRLETWGGKLAENCTQATARDCLRDAMFALDDEGFDIRAHVHDECIVTEPLDGRTYEEMAEVMSRDLPWAPGLPLKAAGYACPYYQKD